MNCVALDLPQAMQVLACLGVAAGVAFWLTGEVLDLVFGLVRSVYAARVNREPFAVRAARYERQRHRAFQFWCRVVDRNAREAARRS